MSKKQVGHDQKRKAKLAKRAAKEARHAPPAEATPYGGSKYKTPGMTPFFSETELAIHEADVLSRRTMTDRQVSDAVTELILQMRAGPLPPVEMDDVPYTPGKVTELIVAMIRRNWQRPTMPSYPLENFIGGLRTVLNSIQIWTARGAHSRGYLSFIEGFLRKGGLTVRIESDDGQASEQPVDDLLDLGREWCETGNADIERSFRREVDERIAAGRPDDVVNICQRLIGEFGEGPQMTALSKLSMYARRRPLEGRESDAVPQLTGETTSM